MKSSGPGLFSVGFYGVRGFIGKEDRKIYWILTVFSGNKKPK